MLHNVIDIESASMATALTQESGASLLFDFAAAFPSVSQTFTRKTLAFLGLPGDALSLVQAIYAKNCCLISLGGSRFEGFHMSAG